MKLVDLAGRLPGRRVGLAILNPTVHGLGAAREPRVRKRRRSGFVGLNRLGHLARIATLPETGGSSSRPSRSTTLRTIARRTVIGPNRAGVTLGPVREEGLLKPA